MKGRGWYRAAPGVRGRALLVGITLASCWATSAPGATIDFDALEVVGFGNTSAGSQYVEDGFSLTAEDSTSPHFQFFETLEPRYPGSTALFFGQPGMSARLEAVSAGTFSLNSIDLALVDGGGGFVAFTGLLAAGGSVFQELIVPTGDIELVTFYFQGFKDLVSVSWVEEFHIGHQFDNIVVTEAPEPTSALLALTTLIVGLTMARSLRACN